MNLEQFYRENYRIVFGYLYSLCGDAAWAEDLTSETFLKAIIKIDSFDGHARPSTWLCTIGRNLYLNRKSGENGMSRWTTIESWRNTVWNHL